MIILQNISKAFGPRDLFKSISFSCPPNSRIALIGNNGAGKTTLLNILCGFEKDYEGEVIQPKGVRLGYLPQEANPNPKPTLLEEALSGAIEVNIIIHQRDAVLERMAEEYTQEIYDQYDYLEQMYNTLECYRVEEDAREILRGLGFKEEQFVLPVDLLSGGWKMRLEFAKMLLNRPNFLILDEPTNHLDLPSIEWFENYLKKFDGTILFVSHDRGLLNRLATYVLHLRQGKLTSHIGNFDKFLDAFTFAQEQNVHAAKHLKQQYEHIEKFVNRFRASPAKARIVQSRLKVLAKLKVLEGGIQFEDLDGNMQLKLDPPKPSGKTVAKVDKLLIGYDKPLIKELSFNIAKGDRVAILGANGLGKSTLLKTILGRHPALGGQVILGHNVVTGYFAQECLEGLREELTIMDNIRANAVSMREPEIRALLASLGISGANVFKPIEVLSGGEKSRVALACMLAQKPNVLFLDEPTNHLDLYACENLANALAEYTGTLIFVSHNRDFIQTVATHTLYLKEQGILQLEKVEE